MKRNKWFKAGLGAGAAALVAAAGLAVASPTLAQGAEALGRTALVQAGLQRGGGSGLAHGGASLTTIATALNMTAAELQTELQAGKSVADVASAKNVSLDTVVNAVIAAQTTTLNQAVTDGRITQAQADATIANLKITVPAQLQTRQVAGLGDRGAGHGGPGGKGEFGVKGGASLTTIATALNMTAAELQTELQANKSVADVASAKGVSLDTVINAIVAEQTTRLNQSVTDGRITQAQADTTIANLKENLPELLALKGGAGGFGYGFGRGHGFGPGKAPGATPNATPAPSSSTTDTTL